MSQFFPSGSQSIGASAWASVLPMNIQDWFPLGWTGWILLQSKGLSRVFSNMTVQKHQFFSAQLSLQSNSHIHTWLLEKPLLLLDGPLLAKKYLWFLICYLQFSSVAQSCPTLRPHKLQHARPPCPSPTPGVHSDSRPSSQWCHPAISSSAVPFSSCP